MSRGRPFSKGRSGNPGGRPRVVGEIRQLAQKHGGEAIAGLLAIARNDKSPTAARVAAWNAVLDRAYGRPAQDLTHHVNPGITVPEAKSRLNDWAERLRGLADQSTPSAESLVNNPMETT